MAPPRIARNHPSNWQAGRCSRGLSAVKPARLPSSRQSIADTRIGIVGHKIQEGLEALDKTANLDRVAAARVEHDTATVGFIFRVQLDVELQRRGGHVPVRKTRDLDSAATDRRMRPRIAEDCTALRHLDSPGPHFAMNEIVRQVSV